MLERDCVRSVAALRQPRYEQDTANICRAGLACDKTIRLCQTKTLNQFLGPPYEVICPQPESARPSRQQLLKRDAHLRRFGCDLRAGITFVLEQALPLESPVLEIGTGKGRFLVRLAKHVRDITTVDISAEEQQSARLNARYFKVEDRIKFVLQDAARLPWPDHSFGAVVTMNAMHHIREFRAGAEGDVARAQTRRQARARRFQPARISKHRPRPPGRRQNSSTRTSLVPRPATSVCENAGWSARLRKGCNQEVLVAQVPNGALFENPLRARGTRRTTLRKCGP